ncbi:hypothetical protein FQR65_LT02565 [Abscondita terminalis]|nr:hypothetical protein FQR65_LT02565 [Abscondita terminalis]
MFRQVLRPRCFKVLLTALKHCIPKARVQNLAHLGVAVVYANSCNIPNFDNIEHEEDLKRATQQGEKYLSHLICMLSTLILETSIEYQQCLIKQIESMSTQKGNAKRSRPQKHQNHSSFKNSLHDTSHRTKFINNIQVSHVCQRCKEIIEWKIKYKKYKPLSQPKTCVKCGERTVRHAYHVMCVDCGKKLKVCTKCCEAKEVVAAPADKEEQLRLDLELQQLIESLSERKRRTFIRHMNKQAKENGSKETKSELIDKINHLKLQEDSDLEDEDFSDFDFSD